MFTNGWAVFDTMIVALSDKECVTSSNVFSGRNSS